VPSDVTCLDIAVTASQVVCGLGSGEAIPYDLRAGTAGESVFDLQTGGIADLALSLDQRSLLAVATDSPAAGQWSLDGRSLIAPVIGTPGAHPNSFSPDGSLLLLQWLKAGGPIQPARRELWDTERLELWKELQLIAAVFTPDGRLAVGFEDATPGLLDPRTGSRAPLAPPRSLQLSTPPAFDRVRNRMALGYADGAFDQRNLATGERVGAHMSPGPGEVSSLAYVDGGEVIAAARGGEVRFLDADTGEAILDPVNGEDVAASPDQSVLVTSTVEGEVTVRDPATGRPTAAEIATAGGRTNNIEISDDNTRMLVVTWGGAAHLYDVRSTTQIGRTLPVSLGVNVREVGANLSPDGRELAVATEHGVQLWDLDPDSWRTAACRLVGRNLTQGEWASYMPEGEPYRATCPQWPAAA
jgi:WD40 repeat protein